MNRWSSFRGFGRDTHSGLWTPSEEQAEAPRTSTAGASAGIKVDATAFFEAMDKLRQAAAAAAQDLGGFNTVFQEFAAKQRAMQDAAKRRKVDDFIRWLAVHQDDEVTA